MGGWLSDDSRMHIDERQTWGTHGINFGRIQPFLFGCNSKRTYGNSKKGEMVIISLFFAPRRSVLHGGVGL